MITTQERFDLSSLDGLREWRDFVVDHARTMGGRFGCPIGSLGAALAETEPEGRAVVAASFKRWEASIWPGFCGCTRLADSSRRPTRASSRSPRLPHLRAASCSLRSSANTEPLAAALDAMLTLIATLSSTTSTSLNR